MKTRRIGLISDTHDVLRPEAKVALAGVEQIIHAGDICSPGVLTELSAIAPVAAVRGNNDRGSWASKIPESRTVQIGDIKIHVIHNVADLKIIPKDVQVVVYGHSHRPLAEHKDGVLFVNPGSAGPRRFTLPVSAGILEITGEAVEAKLQTLVLL